MTLVQKLITRMNTIQSRFNRSLRVLFGQPKGADLKQIEKLSHRAISRYVGGMTISVETAFNDIVSDGMSAVGFQQSAQNLSPETIRSLYHESPLWESYSRMEMSMVRDVNDIIKRHMINTNVIDKYGKPAGLDQYKLKKDIQSLIGLSERRSNVIVRTEVAVVRNKGRELGYKFRDPESEWRYTWGGPYDRPRGNYNPKANYRNAPSCRWIKDQIPSEGLSLEVLKNIVREGTERFHPKLMPRDWSTHPNCRHFPQKVRRGQTA